MIFSVGDDDSLIRNARISQILRLSCTLVPKPERNMLMSTCTFCKDVPSSPEKDDSLVLEDTEVCVRVIISTANCVRQAFCSASMSRCSAHILAMVSLVSRNGDEVRVHFGSPGVLSTKPADTRRIMADALSRCFRVPVTVSGK